MMARSEPKPRGDGAEQLKTVARRLFAERGVDGVTVRDIAEAAGQKNHAAVGYHFGSKEALIRTLVIEGAALIDDRRNHALEALEAKGGPKNVRQVVEVLLYPSVDLATDDEEETYNRFVVLLGMTHRDLLMDALGGRWNTGYLRCMKHLRRLMPDMPDAMKSQRLVFVGATLGAVLAARETQLADRSRAHRTWNAPETLDHFAATMTAMLTAKAR